MLSVAIQMELTLKQLNYAKQLILLRVTKIQVLNLKKIDLLYWPFITQSTVKGEIMNTFQRTSYEIPVHSNLICASIITNWEPFDMKEY